MSSIIKLRKNWQFKRVYNEGRYSADRFVVTYYNKNEKAENIVGFSVSKKVGNSVVRNRTKRRMKEAYRQVASDLKCGYDMVFTARAAAAESNYEEILNSMKKSLERAKLLDRKK